MLIVSGKHDFTILAEIHNFFLTMENMILQFLTGNTQFFFILMGKGSFSVSVGEHNFFVLTEISIFGGKCNFKV